MISIANYSVETKAGILAIEIGEDDTVFMEQQEPTFSEVLDKELIARSLYISSENISQNLPSKLFQPRCKSHQKF